ncbi:MAG: eukaryotic-like serine/threonine-protein kinase [Acidobacteriota bacterium]|jgi:serine/threonine protein kinase|nr:eukaryotic-like serine/threonine-protein kinase [Acidobacteriota bacterium]
MLTPGTILQNRYQVIRQLGQGGMGTVYEAKALRLNTTVALKETHFSDERFMKQFEREAHLLAALRHPALPRVIDHFDENKGLYLVMDFIEGEDLWETLRKRGNAFPVGVVLGWADQLLDALQYLHSQDPPVIHRDIKLQNLKVTGKDRITLLDFGLAKGLAATNVLTTKTVLGYSLPYAPLEQILQIDENQREQLSVTHPEEVERLRRKGTNHRSDLYSAGATLLHLLTNRIPVGSPTRAISVWSGQQDPLAFVLKQSVPEAVGAVLARSMALEPEQRFATAAEMREALRASRQHPVPSVSDKGATTLPITVKPQPQESGEETLVSASPSKAIEFIGNDEAYLRWLGEHLEGCVINTHRSVNPNYMVLHKATCGMIKSKQGIPPGGFTERDYIKICSSSIEGLRAWTRQHGRPDGSFSKSCNACKPLGKYSPPTSQPTEGIPAGEVASIDEPVVAININQQYPQSKTAEELYHATRGIWRLNRRRADWTGITEAIIRVGGRSALQCLVVNKATKLPGEGVGWFIKGLENYATLSQKQQREIIKVELLKICSYPKWQDVLAALGLKPVAVDYSALLKQASNFRGGGESEEHRSLKTYVAEHPELLNLPRSTSRGVTEYRLPSGDSLDVLFRHGDDWIAVEVKSHKSQSRRRAMPSDAPVVDERRTHPEV